MIREFVYTSKFDKEWARLGLSDNLSQSEKKELRKIVKAIGEEFRK